MKLKALWLPSLCALGLVTCEFPGTLRGQSPAPVPAVSWPALQRYVATPLAGNAAGMGMNVRGYPVTVPVPDSEKADYLGRLLGGGTGAELQTLVDYHAADPGLGSVEDGRYRLRVVARGASDFATTLNARAREMNQLALAGGAQAKEAQRQAADFADRRDAARTLATWAMLGLFRAEGTRPDPALLQRRAAEMAVSVDWENVERTLATILPPDVASSTRSPGGAPGISPLGKSHAQSVTFQQLAGEAGADGGGVELFTWYPTPQQINLGSPALRVRVDILTPEAGLAPWSAVRGALPADAYLPESYPTLDNNRDEAAILSGLLLVSRTVLATVAETYRRELLASSAGDAARYRYWRSRATQASAPVGCPPRLRATAMSYLAALYWSEGLRFTLSRRAGAATARAAGDPPRIDFLLPGESPGDDL